MTHRLPEYFSSFSQWLKRYRLDVIICIIIFSVTIATRLIVTLRFPIEVGMDGAYYTINVMSLLNGGYLYYDAPIVSFAVSAGFTLIFHNVILGVKVASAFFAGTLCIGAYFAARNFSRGDWRVGLIAGVLCIVDVSQFQAATSLVKNEAALAFLPIALTFFCRYVGGDRRRVDFIGFLVFGLLTTLSHLMTAALLFASLLVYAGYEFIQRLLKRDWRDALKGVVLPLILGGIIFLGVYIASDLFIPSASTWYTSSSLAKASGYSTSFDWERGVISLLSFFLGTGLMLSPNPLDYAIWVHIGVAILIGLGVFVCLERNRSGDRAALALLFSTLLLGISLATWSWRFEDMYFVPAYIVLAMGLVTLADIISSGMSRLWRNFGDHRFAKKALSIGLVLIVLGGILWIAMPRFALTMNHITPRVRPDDMASIEAMQGMFPSDVMLFAPHGIEYFITSRTGYEAAPESGSEQWPLLAAQNMYSYISEEGRASYIVIQKNSTFLQFDEPLENHLVIVESFGQFEMFSSTLDVLIYAKTSLFSIQVRLIYFNSRNITAFANLTPIGGGYWSGTINAASLPEGTYNVIIIPFQSAPPPPPPTEDVLGDPRNQQNPIFLHHFSELPKPQIPLSQLLYENDTAGTYHIFTVNTTTAAAINLLDLDVSEPSMNTQTRPAELYMIVLTPLFYLPFLGEISNFIILLFICPLTGIYWLGAGTLLLWILQKIALQIKCRIRSSDSQLSQ